MTWLAARLLFGGALKRLWGIVSHASLWQIVSGVLAIIAIVQHFELSRSRAEAAKWHHQFTQEHSGRVADRKSYQQAQTDAAIQNKAQVAAKESQYRKVSTDEKDAYARDHAELVRLRQQRDAAAKGAANSAGASQDRPTASGADGHGMQVPPGDDLQTKDAAADIELRLMHLQNYVEGLLKIDPNKP